MGSTEDRRDEIERRQAKASRDQAVETAGFGQLLRHHRRMAHLSQETLAERSGYSPDYISKLERDLRQPPPSTVDRLSEILGLAQPEREMLQAAAVGLVMFRGSGSLRVVSTPRDSLPAQLTPFVGRQRELQQIAGYLRDPGSRLVSIVGMGGMGKTRLAIKAAEQMSDEHEIDDGVVFISLEEDGAPEPLAVTLLAALALPLDRYLDPRDQLLRYLAERKCLLILDNFEHRLGEVDLLVDILEAAPDVRLLATSRLPLGLRVEQRVPLEGLDYTGEKVTGGSESSEEESAATVPADSVQIFVQAARRVLPGFALTSGNEPDILRICRSVEGLPLALELAASWVRVMDCGAIAAAIDRSLEMLASTARDLPDRHRSIEGVLGESWRLLTDREQELLAQLTVFHGSFSMQAAEGIAGISPVEIAILLDKGLLHRAAGDRYRLHQLLRQFAAAAARIIPRVDLAAVQARHSSYYLHLLAGSEDALYGPNARNAADVLRPKRGNLHEAWLWAAEHEEWDRLTGTLEAAVRLWDLTASFTEAESLLASSIASVRQSLNETRTGTVIISRLLTRLLVWQAHVLEARGHIDDAVQTGQDAQRQAQIGSDAEGEAMAKSVLGELLPHRNEFAAAMNNLQAACRYFEEHHQRRWLARSLSRLGTAYWRAGEYGPAAEHLERARGLQETLHDLWELARVSSALAGVAFEQGDLSEARVHAEAALRLYEACGDRRSVAAMRGNLALLYKELGRFEEALDHNQHDLEMSLEVGDRHDIAMALGNRAEILQDAGRSEESLACLQEALQIEERLGNTWDAARYRASLAHLVHRSGDPDLAIAHMNQALPVLRAHDGRFYLIGPVLNAAELQLDRGRIEEAAVLATEGETLARELGLGDELLRARILEARITDARGRREDAEATLRTLLSDAESEERQALLQLELWRMSGNEVDGQAAHRLYESLYARIPRDLYREGLEELTAALNR
jgi:predicted ATPase/tetratricopeptide (TPR) repeat protein/transcriptional regulator with XRE-family HTH domain